MKFLKTIILFFLPVLFLAQTKNETNPNGYNKYYYDNGVLSSEGYMKDGKADGYWKNYYENGKIKNEGNRKNFQLDSLWKFYNENGKLTKTYYYKEGKKNGFVVTYDTVVKINQKENFIDNIKSGNSYLYYPSGKTKQVIPFVNGKADGWSYEYNEDSVIITTTLYKLGFIERTEKINRVDEKGNKQGMWKNFYADGKVKSESRFKNNEIDGYVKEYTEKGDLKNITKFDNGKKVENPKELVIPDDFKAYFENGNVRYEGSYLNKLPIGTHYYYRLSKQVCDSMLVYDDTIQKKVLNCNYKDNNKTGDWIYYYPNGKTEQQGKYSKTGLPTGEWKWFYENGNLRIIENYRSGKRDGLFKEYLADGKLITSGEYSDDQKEGMWFYEISNYKEEGNYRMGEPDSIWKAYYVNTNQLLFTGNFITGDPVGKHVMYYENGKTMCVGNYEGGMKQGNWKYFEETGELIISIDYENDIERKWNNVVILPTYEESLRAYEGKQKMSAPGK